MASIRSYGIIVALITSPLLGVGAASAGVIPDFGFDFVTIGDTGNPVYVGLKPGINPDNRGAINYAYRLTRTEVTAGQWFEFVLAYAPFVATQAQGSSNFTSSLITFIGPGPSGVPQYVLVAGAENLPARMSWRFAARFCNWLHNGKVNEQWAFETGAYDTSTFTQVMTPDGSFTTDQPKHDPGARFWIPTLDEWLKGVYWDPNKDGRGLGGWWTQPGGSDEPLTVGLPNEGGQTSAGTQVLQDVGSYPMSPTPMGLLDASGGQIEWLEDKPNSMSGVHRLVAGTSSHGSAKYVWILDNIEHVSSGDFFTSINGLRLASRVTEPTSPMMADLNQDGVVDVVDLATLLANWGPCTTKPGSCRADLNSDTVVDGADVIDIFANWGPAVE